MNIEKLRVGPRRFSDESIELTAFRVYEASFRFDEEKLCDNVPILAAFDLKSHSLGEERVPCKNSDEAWNLTFHRVAYLSTSQRHTAVEANEQRRDSSLIVGNDTNNGQPEAQEPPR